MKKSLAFILAFIMLISALFCVVPMAEGETEAPSTDVVEKYVPEIAYANVNYVDSISLMFAVPVPAELAEGEAVQLLIWASRDDSLAFNNTDMNKIVILPEETKASIGGAEYLVFKYNGLDASQMLNVVCARPVVVKDGKAVSYGKLVEYSIREYVEAAKGNFDDIAGVDNADVIEALDTMLSFGAYAQRSTGKRYDVYADDELHKVYVNATVNGKEAGRIFAGFFKYEEDEKFTLAAPFFDGTQVGTVYDADGNKLEDLDIYSEGVQLMTVDSDIELTVNYTNRAIKTFSGKTVGKDFAVNNYVDGVVGGNLGYITYSGTSSIMINGVGHFNLATKSSATNHYWNGVKTITDPEDPDNDVVQFTATHLPQFVVKLETPFSYAGVGDTVEPTFTIELELGSINVPANTSHLTIKHRVKSPATDSEPTSGVYFIKVFDGVLKLYDGTGYNIVVGELPMNALRKFAFVFDPIAETIKAYAESESGEMEFVAATNGFSPDSAFMKRQAQHQKNLADDDPTNDQTLAAFESYYKFFLESPLEFTFLFGANKGRDQFSDLVSNGMFTDMEAVQERAEQNYSFLLDNYNIYVGSVYN